MRSAAVTFDLVRAVSDQAQTMPPRLATWLRWPRVAASSTLLLVILGAAAASVWAPRPTVVGRMMIATEPVVIEAVTPRGEPQVTVAPREQVTVAPREQVAAAPREQVAAVQRESVKIVGGTPRSDNCADQVWPYIEYRCLAVPAAGSPQMVAVSRTASPPRPAMAPFEPVRAASANDEARPELPTAARPAIAIAWLTLPPQREGAGVPDGARSRSGDIGLSDLGRRTDGSAYPVTEQPTFGKSRQRAGRRAYRSRYGRGWNRRQPFGSLF
jgi:hypothetical protein